MRAMGVPWAAMAGATSRYYLGSPASTPCICLVDAIGEHIRATRPDLAPAVVEGTFRSIVLDPADLFPGRGGAVAAEGPHVAAEHAHRAPDRPAASRRDTAGWRPPTYRRPEVPAGPPTTAVGSSRS
jgi:hypothetical protein